MPGALSRPGQDLGQDDLGRSLTKAGTGMLNLEEKRAVFKLISVFFETQPMAPDLWSGAIAHRAACVPPFLFNPAQVPNRYVPPFCPTERLNPYVQRTINSKFSPYPT